MPGKLRADNIFEELRRLRARRTWTEPQPVYVAAGLIVVAAMLLLAIISGVKHPSTPVPTAPSARREAPAEPVARSEAPSRVPAAAEKKDKPDDARDLAPRRPVAGGARLAYGWQYNPLYGDWRYHPGVDLAAPAGSVVKALWTGRVTKVYEDRQFGLTVVVTGSGYTVFYGSLATAAVDANETIPAGGGIGKVGEASGEPYPHLHLAVMRGERYVDPQEILAKIE